ncbi:MAG: hypothetical protein QM493_08880 [Sulfurovum sp.]
MCGVIFIGLQASGKSTFFLENFYKTHIRINFDMLKTRHRENIFLKDNYGEFVRELLRKTC